MKTCRKCKKAKDEFLGFYRCSGRLRNECKECTIKQNSKYQREKKPWLNRDEAYEDKKEYMRLYRAENKEKFAEYRRKFKEKHPGYYRDYFRDLKNKI